MIRRRFLGLVASSPAILAPGQTQPDAAARPQAVFKPSSHAADDWLDRIPGRHRLFLDAVTAKGADEALLFADNYYLANRTAYDLPPSDLAVVIGLRHYATLFAFSDAMWTKYGLARQIEAAARPAAGSSGNGLTSRLLAADKQGVRFAVCDLATHYFAGETARRDGVAADAVYKDLVANTIGACQFVAAGIVGVQRAQERGYSIAYVG